MKRENQKVWFITGISTGFGKELAKVVEDKGDVVVGTFRSEEQMRKFNEGGTHNRLGVQVDVTSLSQINQAVEKAIHQFGQIDVLVNNAGYGSLGSIEEIPEDEIRKQFDVNVFGPINLIKVVLPYMRKRRSGHILNVTSIGGLVGFPSSGVYNGSKFALEGLGESLALQVAPLGIKVTNIEPGPFRTDWAGRSATFVQSDIKDYKPTIGKHLEGISNLNGNQIGDPVRAAQAMFEITQVETPPVHLPLGASAYKGVRQKWLTMQTEIDSFEHIGLPTDYTEEEQLK
ncbi:MAG: SDR family NAD(P)-dependent oxidoreductase [Cyclobacteriaceae bacterium]|nr:SDR family NAD(P)-dependent oxidoreductase [Cyclobacteriaceae bacterium HetDA_MAG_MS6]